MKTFQIKRKTANHLFALGLFVMSLMPFHGYCQASLIATDAMDVIINYNGQDEVYTILRDATSRSQFYYVPKTPRLTEITIDGKVNPEFSLLRYQFVDPKNPSGKFEGGLAQFAITLAPEKDALIMLTQKIKDDLSQLPGGTPADFALSALPIKAATAAIYSPVDNTLVSNSFGNGTYPNFATQKAVFALTLTSWGADVNDALVGHSAANNTGIPVVITFSYQGLTPPAHLKIIANYKQIFTHYSQDKMFAAKASYFGLFGASTQIHWSTINEELKKDGALKIEKITSDEISDDDMDAIMQSVMKRINDNIGLINSPPPAIPPASASTPSLNDRFFSAGYNASFKTVTMKQTYQDTLIWDERKIVTRSTLAAGFIGLAKYPEDVRDRAVKFVPSFDWDLAYLTLPDITELANPSKVLVNTDLVYGNEIEANAAATWTPSTGWLRNSDHLLTSENVFSVKSVLAKNIKFESLKFKTTTTVSQNGRNVTVVDVQDVVQNSVPIVPPSQVLTHVDFDPSELKFNSLIPSSNLIRVLVTMTLNKQTYNGTFQPKIINGNLTMPETLSWVVRRDDIASNPVHVTLHYDYTNGTDPVSRDVDYPDLSKITGSSLNLLVRDPARKN